ncbi:hypothetical protein Q0590_08495 [Rhodocytophaga aerolata]|uniref:DUF3854 domain-containing protein n=1 Tax=Rhodocytophaga aerolata TaxID=455078 RepID=A0ABT8R4R3_9BACT|nr:hypothetical protein [Rhodocytophaga aerolata]MDO1446288.1 hypothetical protein [Rhodocytophaga aerolata]
MNTDTISFAQKVLAQMGITHEQNTVIYSNWKGNEVEGQIIYSDAHDDMLIRFLDPDGKEAIYYDGKNNPRPYIVRRKKIPDSKGKYINPYKAEATPFLPPEIITKIKTGVTITTLYITEGPKKAFVASVKGLDCIATLGIFQFRPKGSKELHPYILEIIKRCKVKNLVLLFDADAKCMTSHDETLQPEDLITKDLAYRSNGFASAAKNLKESCLGVNVDAYVGYIKPENKAKGLDDLFIQLPEESQEIITDAKALSKAESYFTILSLKDNSNSKLNSWFGLDDFNNFYKIHESKLGLNDFNYRGKLYAYNPETEKVEVSKSNYDSFWFETEPGVYRIDIKNFLEFLGKNGYMLYRLNVNDFYYVRVKENVVSIVATKDIKDFTCGYVESLKVLSEVARHDIINTLLLFSSLFSREKLESLKAISPTFHTDTPHQMFFYFQNGFIEVTKDNTILRPYSELSGYIWDTQIIKRDYVQPAKGSLKDFMFVQFVQNICSIKENEQWQLDKDRLESFVSILGYLLHSAKRERKAIVFTDTDIADNPEGRTGKTIIGRAMGELRPYCEIDGKNFNPDDRFKYQNATIDTQIMHINDAGRGKKKFDFELMFTAVTEGVTVEKKNQASFIIRPTILISSNRAIEISGGSAKARVIEFEFANYYSDTFSPKDEFDAWFFDDWNHKDWHLFYYFLFNCCRSYLANGLIKPSVIHLDERKLIQTTGNNKDFMDFAKEHIFDYTNPNAKINQDGYNKSDLLSAFRTEFPEYTEAILKPNTFTKWLKAYAGFINRDYDESKSNGIRYALFKAKQGKSSETGQK